MSGQTQAMFGIYEVELVDDALRVTPHLDPGAEQMAIPAEVFDREMPSVDADDEEPGLTAFDRQVLANATAGLLPCPCCGEPLLGQPSHIAGEPTIHLFCPDSKCGFEEV